MQTISELLAMGHQTSFFEIQNKINKLFVSYAISFNLGDSTSRNDATLMDLRSDYLASTDENRESIRSILSNLKKLGLIDYEEKSNNSTQKIVFIITKVNTTELLLKPIDELNTSVMSDMHSEVIRVGNHNIEVKYYTTKLGLCINNITAEETVPSLVSPQSFFASGESMVTIAQLLSNSERLDKIKSEINECFNLDSKSGFQLYLQSSHPSYPIDLRVYLPEDSEKTSRIRRILEGFSLSSQIIFEEKTMENSSVPTLIIKALKLETFASYLTKLAIPQIHTDALNEVIVLLQNVFSDSSLVKNLVVLDGKTSALFPYPHIRTATFYSESNFRSDYEKLITMNTLQVINNQPIVSISRRPETESKVADRDDKYISVIPCNNYQLIIDVKDVDALKEHLKSGLTNSNCSAL